MAPQKPLSFKIHNANIFILFIVYHAGQVAATFFPDRLSDSAVQSLGRLGPSQLNPAIGMPPFRGALACLKRPAADANALGRGARMAGDAPPRRNDLERTYRYGALFYCAKKAAHIVTFM